MDPTPGRPSRTTLALCGTAVLLGIAVLVLGELTVHRHAAYAVDQRWSHRIFDVARYRPHVRELALVTGRVTDPWVWRGVTVVCALLLWRRGRGTAAAWWVAALSAAGLAGVVLKQLVARERPHWPGAYTTVDGYTFPSGHATNVAAFVASALIIAWPVIGPRLRILAAAAGTLLVFGVGADRVLLGVHHVSDVLAGWALGLAVVLACAAGGVDDARWVAWVRAAFAELAQPASARIALVGGAAVLGLVAVAAIAPGRAPAPPDPGQLVGPTSEAPHVQGTYSPPPDPFPGAHGGKVPIRHIGVVPIPVPAAGAVQVEWPERDSGVVATSRVPGLAGQRLGTATATGDLDRDGYPDAELAAPDAPDGGRVVVVFGGPSGLDPGTAVRVRGTQGPGARFGAALSVTEPNERDPQLWVGAPGETVGTASEAGAAYRYTVTPERKVVLHQRITLDYLGYPMRSEAGDHFGAALDAPLVGVPDKDVGAETEDEATAGQVVVDAGAVVQLLPDETTGAVYSARQWTIESWTQLSTGARISLYPGTGDHLGATVDAGGLVGVPGRDGHDDQNNGAQLVDAGMVLTFRKGADELEWPPGPSIVRGGEYVTGRPAAGDRLGASLAVRQFGDGWQVLLGIPGADQPGAPDAGAVAQFGWNPALGRDDTGYRRQLVWAGNQLPGRPEAGAELGSALGILSQKGDMDGDAADVVLIGAPGADGGRGLVVRDDTGGYLYPDQDVWRYRGATPGAVRFGATLPRRVDWAGGNG